MAIDYGSDFGEAFQKHILAVMCKVPGFCLRYRSALDHRFFVNDAHRAISSALLAHVDEDHRVPTMPTLLESVRETVAKEDAAGIETALKKLYAEDVSDATAVMRKVVDFGKQQALVNAVMESAEKLDKGDRKIRPIIDAALLVGEDLLDVGIDYKKQVEARRSWYTNPDTAVSGIRTGIGLLDLIMQGGLGRGELGVIVAPPKRGKSTTLINIGFGALAAVDGLNVVHYSMEMKKARVVQRYDDRLMGLRVKYKRSDPETYSGELCTRTKLLPGRLFVQDYPTRSAGVSTLRSHLALLASRDFRPDLIIVDYADIMKPERRLGEMRHEQAGIYEDLRQLAGEFDAACWTGSQAKASALDKETITLIDFAEAFEKAAIVDAAFAFCQTNDERIDGRARLFAAGLRNMEDGRTVECEIRRDCCLMRSIGVLDMAGTRIMGAVDDRLAVDTTIHPAGTKTHVTQMKRSVGLTKKQLPPKTAGKPAFKKKMLDRPSKQLNLS